MLDVDLGLQGRTREIQDAKAYYFLTMAKMAGIESGKL